MNTAQHRKMIEVVLKQLQEQGWSVNITKKAHYQCIPPNPKAGIVLVGTGGEYRAFRNALSQLRRSGASLHLA